jgi:ribosome-binding protein aMBF1 (putative translation factor)
VILILVLLVVQKYNERHPAVKYWGSAMSGRNLSTNKAHQLKKKRIKSGLSQEKLGSRIYRSASWVSWVERGRIPLKREVVREYLAGVLGGIK